MRISIFITLVVILAACTSARPAGEGPSSAAPAAPKVLTIATTREPPFIEGFHGGGSTGGSGDIKHIAHAYLAVLTEDGTYKSQVAREPVTIASGNWRVNPDNSMDMTWKLHPNVTWHDGAPFTSADMMFTFKVMKDPDLPTPPAAVLALMESAEAPDPLTFVVHWSQPYALADGAEGLTPLPRHLLDPLYEAGDKDAFVKSPYLTTGWIGLGPYRLDRWMQGSTMEFGRFDAYFEGRPALDRVIVRFIKDSNSLVAEILAGAVDVLYPPGADTDAALNVRDRWAGTGNAVRFDAVDARGRLRILINQNRVEYAQPPGTLTNPLVRQALYRALDRPGFVEAMTHGIAPVADSWILPTDARRPAMEDAIPKYPFDPSRAEQLLAEAGWRPGPDGILVNASTGERFNIQLRAAQVGGAQVGKDRELTVVADSWKRVGVESSLNLQTIGASGDRGYEAVQPGIFLIGNMSPLTNLFRQLNSRFVATEANRWTGFNLTGFSDPQIDSLLDRYYVTIEPTERLNLDRQLVQKGMGDVVVLPLYWEVVPTVVLEGVDASLASPLMIYRFYQWNKK
jgi:peptide/nickel transport system substrate-binding protein